MSEFEIYLITRLDSIVIFLTITVIISIVTAIIIGVMAILSAEEVGEIDIKENSRYYRSWRSLIKWFKVFLSYSIIGLLLGIFIPSTKDYIAMRVVPIVLNDEEVQKIPEEFIAFIRGWMKENTPKIETKE